MTKFAKWPRGKCFYLLKYCKQCMIPFSSRSYGFKEVYTTLDVLAWKPSYVPSVPHLVTLLDTAYLARGPLRR